VVRERTPVRTWFARSSASPATTTGPTKADALAEVDGGESAAAPSEEDELPGEPAPAPEAPSVEPAPTAPEDPAPPATPNPIESAPALPVRWAGLEPHETDPGGIVRAGSKTIITGVAWPVPTQGRSQPTCVTVDLTDELDVPYAWSFQIKRDGTPFYGAGYWWYQGANQARFDVGAEWITVTGVGDGRQWNPDWFNRDVNGQRALKITACSTPVPAPTVRYGDHWYDVTESRGAWTPTQACVTLTARGHIDPAVYPFRYGWAGTFDLREAKARITGAGKTVYYVSFSPQPEQDFQFHFLGDGRTQPVQDRYDIGTGTMTALHGMESKTITACVHGY
jgi:hypothetical protein